MTEGVKLFFVQLELCVRSIWSHLEQSLRFMYILTYLPLHDTHVSPLEVSSAASN